MLSRTILRPASRSLRHASTTTATSTRAQVDASHALAGLAGGGTVLLGLYAYYHYSGTAQVISQSKSIINLATSTKDKIAASTPDRSQAFAIVKSGVKYYSSAIPGSGPIIDSSFEKLETIMEKDSEKVMEIYNQLIQTLKEGEASGEDVLKVLIDSSTKLASLAGAGQVGDWLSKLTEGNADLKKVLGDSGEDLGEFAKKYGPEAQKIATDSFDQAKTILKEGGLNEKTYERVSKLIKEKREEITKLGRKSGTELLDKLPDIKKFLDSEKIEGLVGEDKAKVVKEVYGELEKLATSGKSAGEMTKAAKELLEKKFGSLDFEKMGIAAKDFMGGDGMIDKAGSMIGITGLSKMLGAEEIEHLKKLATDESKEGKKLLESTYSELKEVLKKKMEEAKKIGGDIKKEAGKK